MQTYQGIPASRGIAIGPVFQFKRANLQFNRATVSDRVAEWRRFQAAMETARQQMTEIYERASRETSQEAGIFRAELEMLDDPELMNSIQLDISMNGTNAEAALMDVAQSYAATLSQMENETFASRAADVLDVAHRILRALTGSEDSPTEGLETPSIIIADTLTPSDTIQIDKELVMGFCTVRGSATSHAAILARSMDVPAVAGIDPGVLAIQDGSGVILDGTGGVLIHEPSMTQLADYQERHDEAKEAIGAARRLASSPAVTRDGQTIEVAANIGDAASARVAVENGADAAGLLRSEFIYMDRSRLPSEEEQYQAYREILQVFGERPVILRTLDINGDKDLPYLRLSPEPNPALGMRGLRLSLARRDLFKPQLRAALRAALHGNLRLMFPMAATAAEVVQARQVLYECRAELRTEDIPCVEEMEVGVMIETPAAALTAGRLAMEVNFFSIGTNDLAQYTMAADRANPDVAGLSNAFHPAVLVLVREVIDAAHDAGIWCGLCGELAGEPLAVPILAGLGLDEFSVAPPLVPSVKQNLRGMSIPDMRTLAADALVLDTPEAVIELVRRRTLSTSS